MILSKDFIKQAVSTCQAPKAMKDLQLSYRLQTNHSLCHKSQNQTPLFSCACQSECHLPLMQAASWFAAGVAIILLCHGMRKKKKQKQK